jgi:hypothetical protein
LTFTSPSCIITLAEMETFISIAGVTSFLWRCPPIIFYLPKSCY